MYRNFKLTEEEKKEIMEMHQSFKEILKEQQYPYGNNAQTTNTNNAQSKGTNVVDIRLMQVYVDTAVSCLDGWVSVDDLKKLYGIVYHLKDKVFQNNSNALSEFTRFYSIDERGDSFLKDVMSVGTATLGVEGQTYKDYIVKTVNNIKRTLPPVTVKTKKVVVPKRRPVTKNTIANEKKNGNMPQPQQVNKPTSIPNQNSIERPRPQINQNSIS